MERIEMLGLSVKELQIQGFRLGEPPFGM